MKVETSRYGRVEREVAGVPERELLEAKRPGTGVTDTEPLSFDPRSLRHGRLARLRALLKEQEYAGCLLFDPYNQRYATGSRNMFGYFLRNSTRYFFVAADGPVILFEYPQSSHTSEVLDTVDEARVSRVVWSSVRGRDDDTARPFAQEVAALAREHGRGSRRVGMDRCFHGLALALEREGLEVHDVNQDILRVRSVKTPEEIACLELSMVSTEAAVYDVMQAIRPGVTEQELFAELYRSVIASGGEMIETRLLSSGPRTNPWFNEASARRVRPGELVALDTDTVGNFGYYSDFSRTFHCGPGKPTGPQKALYQMAFDQLQHNVALVRPGVELREIADKAWRIPDRFVERRYTSVMHGCGMHGESPFVAHAMDWEEYGVDGVLEPNMVLCVESYIGEVGGREGVKLEEEVLVTATGIRILSRFPFDEALLG